MAVLELCVQVVCSSSCVKVTYSGNKRCSFLSTGGRGVCHMLKTRKWLRENQDLKQLPV